MNYRRTTIGLVQIGVASLAVGFLAYDAVFWFPLGLDNAQALMRILLGLAGIGIACIACGAAMQAAVSPVRFCLTWGSSLVAGSMLLVMVLPLNAFFLPLIAALVSGLLLLLIGGLRTATRRFGSA
jgi:hypothetical protein